MLTLLFAMSIPSLTLAMSHEDHSGHGKAMAEEKMKHGDMKHADEGMHKGHEMVKDHAKDMSHDMHKGHDMAGAEDDFVEIGKDTQKGVVATVKVKTYDAETMASMKKMGMDATHHVMVFFADEKSGTDITSGKAALKIKGEDAKPLMLMQMGAGFGSDLSLGDGMYTFEIGTKLEDGDKRQFSIMFHNM
jgi:hypothetical protein